MNLAATFNFDGIHVSAKRFSRDERGAVMLMGLFFSTFLVGSLWYLIGIGQALAFRERAQEVADSAALSSAIVHAQGMNFISALNLIQFALVIGHMVFAIIYAILLVVSIILAPETLGIETILQQIAEESSLVPWWKSYDEAFMFNALDVAAITQTAVSATTPWVGQVAAAEVGGRYHEAAYAPSMSMIPTAIPEAGIAFGIAAILNATSPNTLPGKVGLPVTEQTFSFLCGHAFAATFDWVRHLILDNFIYKAVVGLANSVVGGIGGILTGTSGLVHAIREIDHILKGDPEGYGDVILGATRTAGQTLTSMLFCNSGSIAFMKSIPVLNKLPGFNSAIDSFNAASGPAKVAIISANPFIPPAFDPRWGAIFMMGPKAMATGSGNGTDWMYVWGYAGQLGSTDHYTDNQSHNVSVAGRQVGAGSEDIVRHRYVSQAEFYYDCDARWGECNAGDAAVFGMRWRARLRQVRSVNVANDLIQVAALDAIGNLIGGVLGPDPKKVDPTQLANRSVSDITKKELGFAGSKVGAWAASLAPSTDFEAYH